MINLKLKETGKDTKNQTKIWKKKNENLANITIKMENRKKSISVMWWFPWVWNKPDIKWI